MAYPPAGGDRSGSLSLRSQMRLVERRNDERKCVSQTSNRKNHGVM
ncbi:hypothetical protein [Nostoc sp. LEGE 12450]|nr:hypothetical protein [Nostoc sp. LEGE 12450]MBE8989171.1 hypothetical protein [Nostoc sp. LEGE 12450]